VSTKSDHLRVIPGGEGSTPPAPPDPLIGQVIDGRYQIEDTLGEGGMGIVYRARHTVLNKPLAVKVLRAEVSRNEEIMARFRQEAQSATSIGNEHIIDISDFGQLADGSTYFVMELLDGLPLTDALEQSGGPMETGRVVHIAKQLCLALGAAHDRGIVHRDLKPDNIFLVERGGDPNFVKVLDFGIAKVGDGPSKLTQAGQVFGTPHYMSPEQCAGTGVDHRTDIYALGVILYEMAASRVPFDADNLMGILTKHMYEEPPPPHTLPPPVDVPAALEAVILKCLAKSRDARYQSMAEVHGDLVKVEQGLTPDAVFQNLERASGGHTGGGFAPARSTGGIGMTVGEPTASGELPAPGRRLGPLVVGAVLLLGLPLAGYFFFGGRLGGSGDATSAAATDDAVVDQAGALVPTGDGTVAAAPTDEGATGPVGAGTPPATQAPPPSPPPVALSSEPEEVEVWLGDELLGNTPLDVARPTDGEPLQLQLRRAGYESQDVRISELTSPTVKVTLERERRRARSRNDRRRPRSAPSRTREATGQGEASSAPRERRGVTSEVLDPWAN